MNMTAEPVAKVGDGNLPGTLYLVPTPIGNLGDITIRALEILGRVSRILAEDTRHTGILLRHHHIATPQLSLTEHNVSKRLAWILEELAAGRDLAVVSDAGMPLVCDPGLPVVREVAARGWPVIALPGPCAPVTALAASGFAGDAFVFEGFLPKKPGQRQTRLALLARESRTVIFFESPHRLQAVLEELVPLLEEQRQVVVARELTKLYENYHRGNARTLADHFRDHPPRGEIVVLLAGQTTPVTAEGAVAQLLDQWLPELGIAETVRRVARQTGLPRSQVYGLALNKQGKMP